MQFIIREQVRLLDRLVVHQRLQVLEVTVLLGQLDLLLILAVGIDSELEQVDTFSALNHLVIKFGANVRSVNVVRRVASSICLLVAKQEVS